jgi:hypothetical protein
MRTVVYDGTATLRNPAFAYTTFSRTAAGGACSS